MWEHTLRDSQERKKEIVSEKWDVVSHNSLGPILAFVNKAILQSSALMDARPPLEK